MIEVIGGVRNHWRGRWPEWALATAMIVQCVVLLVGGNYDKNQLYSVLRGMLDMQVAAGFALMVAVLWVVALVLNGTFVEFRRISPWVRVITATICASYWTLWAVTLWQAAQDYTSLGWLNYATFAGMASMCIFMAAGEVAHADRKAKQWRSIRQRTGGR